VERVTGGDGCAGSSSYARALRKEAEVPSPAVTSGVHEPPRLSKAHIRELQRAIARAAVARMLAEVMPSKTNCLMANEPLRGAEKHVPDLFSPKDAIVQGRCAADAGRVPEESEAE